MKRDFLKNLGIEDKELIDKILDENSADIGKAKGELESYKTKVTELEADIKSKDATIASLQVEADKVEGLNQTITQLTADKENLTNELTTKVSEIQKGHAIESKIRDRKGKNVKAIRALLDESKITFENNELGGIDEQLEALENAEDSSMLFGEIKPPAPAGTNLVDPATSNNGNPPTSTSLAEAVAKALNGNK